MASAPPPPAYEESLHYQHSPQVVPPIIHQPEASAYSEKILEGESTSLRLDMAVRIGNRLVIDFEKVSCLMGQKVGLHSQVKHNVPNELRSKGISPELWLGWMSKLEEIQQLAPSVCGCLLMFCFPGGIVQAMLCACFCPFSSDHFLSCLPCCYGDWYAGLKQWMEEVNVTLNRVNMHAKLMTYKPFNSAPKSKLYGDRTSGKDEHYEMSFLVISLTAKESEKLQQESWDHGVDDRCTSGNGRCL